MKTIKPDIPTVEVELPFSGFYESVHGEQIAYGIESSFQDNQGIVPDDIADVIWSVDTDNSACEVDYAKAYVDLYASAYDLTLEFRELSSPKYYNFSTDRIFALEPITEIEAIRKLCTAHELWPEYIRERFTSYDGFSSNYDADATAADWTKPLLDACQYHAVLSFWSEHIAAKLVDITELIVEEPYNLPAIDAAITKIDAALEAKGIKTPGEIEREAYEIEQNQTKIEGL